MAYVVCRYSSYIEIFNRILGKRQQIEHIEIVLDGDPAPQKGGTAPNFRPVSIVAKRLYVSGYHLVRRYASAYGTLC